MTDARTVWGIHMEWDDAVSAPDTKDIAIGWEALGDLNALPAQRDAFKELFAKAYPADKAGAVPVKAGILFRFAKEMKVGDVVVYPRCKETLDNFTRNFSPTMHAAIRLRIAKLKQDTAIIGGLKYNLKARDDAPHTFEAPTVRRRIFSVPTKPESRGELTPILAEDHYQHIISILVLMNQVMERSPKAFAKMGEEDIRTHYLVQLNGHYEGNATGETFNLEGKTDISIRVDGTVIFVAELKFWNGPRSLSEAIDQLLGYVTWRDTKTALIIFARRKDFTKVVAAAVAETPMHPNFKSGPSKEGDTRFRYLFKNKNDFSTVSFRSRCCFSTFPR